MKLSPVLDNKFYKIQYNRVSGAITSIFDKTLGVELVEANSPHVFNGYLYEFRTSTKGMDFNSVWSHMDKADLVRVTRGPVADELTVIEKLTE